MELEKIMKNFWIFLLLILPYILNAQAVGQKTKNLIWYDEFEYTGLPDSSKWTYEEGVIRNKEAQYYTRARLENAKVENGVLTITARKEEYRRKEDYRETSYTSASIHTKGRFEFKGGRVEVRAKLPAGRGVWPAIWTLGTNMDQVGWPLCGEIDIMEFVGYEPDFIYAHVHTGNSGRGDKIIVEKPFADFHVYALEWYDDRLDFYFDGVKYYTCSRKGEGIGEWPFDAPQYLILNLAIGGGWGGQKGIDDSIFPVEYQIDYVRIYTL